MFAEDDLRPISALQHLLFCERQCALIHLEQQWEENALTVTGRQLHEKVDGGKGKRRKVDRARVTRSMVLRSFRLGLFGRADAVEFLAGSDVGKPEAGWHAGHATSAAGDLGSVGREVVKLVTDDATSGAGDVGSGAAVGAPTGPQAGVREGRLATGVPFPVEYKRGKPKKNRCDEVQLCAQALCLEEMLGVHVPAGAIYYGVTKRRVDIPFDAELRQLTLDTIARLHEMMQNGVTPRARREKKCDRCSLVNLCVPDVLEGSESASRYLERVTGMVLAGVILDA